MIVGLTIDAYYFSALRGLGRFSLLVGYRIGANLAQILALIVAWWLGVASVPLAVGIYALTYLIPIALIEVRPGPVRAILGGVARPRRSLMGPLTRFAIPALVSGTAYAAILGLDVYWVRILAPDHLADYSAARALAMPMSLVPFAIGVVLLPRVAATDTARRWRLLRQAMLATTAAATLAVDRLRRVLAARRRHRLPRRVRRRRRDPAAARPRDGRGRGLFRAEPVVDGPGRPAPPGGHAGDRGHRGGGRPPAPRCSGSAASGLPSRCSSARPSRSRSSASSPCACPTARDAAGTSLCEDDARQTGPRGAMADIGIGGVMVSPSVGRTGTGDVPPAGRVGRVVERSLEIRGQDPAVLAGAAQTCSPRPCSRWRSRRVC